MFKGPSYYAGRPIAPYYSIRNNNCAIYTMYGCVSNAFNIFVNNCLKKNTNVDKHVLYNLSVRFQNGLAVGNHTDVRGTLLVIIP